MITLTTEQARQIEEALARVEQSAEECMGDDGMVMVVPLDLYNELVESLEAIRAARAQEQAEQEPVSATFEDKKKSFAALKKEVKTPDDMWTVADGINFFGFFSHGWDAARKFYAAPQPVKQEPVAWVGKGGFNECGEGKPLYAAPVRTKDLTDEEQLELARSSVGKSRHWLVAAVIAAYKEKNNANNNS